MQGVTDRIGRSEGRTSSGPRSNPDVPWTAFAGRAGRPAPPSVGTRPAKRPRGLLLSAIAVLVLAGVLLITAWSLPSPSSARSTADPHPIDTQLLVPATLSNGTSRITTSPEFWALVVQTTCPTCIASKPAVGTYLNQTPFDWFRYSQQSDQCNLTANTLYSDSGSVMGGCGFDVTSFKQWCSSRASSCHAILDLPGENNNSAEDASIANYIVNTIGYQPEYWAIGNEPNGWKHYGIPWAQWSTSDNSVPTPTAYAYDVRAAIAAVRSVDASAKFIGIQASCECNTAWFQAVAKIDGPNLSAIAYHTYPSTALSTTVTLQQFYDPLASSANITTSFPKVRQAISGYCNQCNSLPILVDEFNAGPGWAPSNYGGSYANAVFLAASTIQALRANVTQFAVFDLQTYSTTHFGFSLMNASYGVGPTGILYSRLLNHLAEGTILGANVRTSVPSVWAVISENSSTESLLVVNANLTQSITLSLGTAFPTAVGGTAYQWAPGMNAPNASVGSVVSVYTVPSQGVLLINAPIATRSPATSPLYSTASASPVSGIAPLSVRFNGGATGGTPSYSYSWNFGDGASSTSPTPTHLYQSAGSYAARLTVTDSAGSTSSASVAISATPTPIALTATASAAPATGPAPLFVQFAGHPSGGTGPYSYQWTFGGTRSSTQLDPNDTYLYPGSYTATFTVTDATGAIAVATTPIAVSSPVTAVVTLSHTSIIAGHSITATASVMGAVGGVLYAWSINGANVSGSSASIQFRTSTAGSYVFAVTAVDSRGFVAHASATLAVTPSPKIVNSGPALFPPDPLGVLAPFDGLPLALCLGAVTTAVALLAVARWRRGRGGGT